MPYGKEGIKVLKQDLATLKKNPPKMTLREDGSYITEIWSVVFNEYIEAGTWATERVARKALGDLHKQHKENMSKIKRFTTMKESVEEEFMEKDLKKLKVSSIDEATKRKAVLGGKTKLYMVQLTNGKELIIVATDDLDVLDKATRIGDVKKMTRLNRKSEGLYVV